MSANGGCPFVLAEHEKKLERLEVEAFEPPDGFWEKLDHLRVVHHGQRRDANVVLWITRPNPNLDYTVVRRQTGMGSLGQYDTSLLPVGKEATSPEMREPSCPRHAFGWSHRKSRVLL